jgi:hypothetical protein
MARHHNAEGKQRNNISKRVSTLEREVKQLTRKSPIPPEQQASMAAAMREARPGEKPDAIRVSRGNADYETPNREHLARLQGRSRSDLVSDAARQASSPLGRRRK